MRRCGGIREPGGISAGAKAAIILGILSCLIAPQAIAHAMIDSVSQAALPATLMSLVLLATALEKRK